MLADPTQVHQVVMNLCTNAAHAMSDQPGTLSVALDRVDAGPELVARVPGVEPVRYARLCVRDTGSGMSAETLAQIFNPFFTTIGSGRGYRPRALRRPWDSREPRRRHPRRKSARGGHRRRMLFPGARGATGTDETEEAALPRGRGEHVLFVDDEAARQRGPTRPRATRLSDDRLYGSGRSLEALRRSARGFPPRRDRSAHAGHDRARSGSKRFSPSGPPYSVILISGYSGASTEKVKALGIREVIAKPLSISARQQHGRARGQLTPRGSWPP